MSEWRCPRCTTLLGVQTGDTIECKYKVATYRIVGHVIASCRRCGAEASWSTHEGARTERGFVVRLAGHLTMTGMPLYAAVDGYEHGAVTFALVNAATFTTEEKAMAHWNTMNEHWRQHAEIVPRPEKP